MPIPVVIGVPLTIGVGLAVAELVRRVAKHRGLQRWQAIIGGFCGGCLFGVAAGDGLISGAGGFWASHPMFAAAVGGALLIGLTAIVIEAAIEHGNTLRRRDAAQKPVNRWLEKATEAHNDLDASLKSPSPDATAIGEAGEKLNAAVIAARTMTPLFLFSPELLKIYDAAEAFTDRADDVVHRCRRFSGENPQAAKSEKELQHWRTGLTHSVASSEIALGDCETARDKIYPKASAGTTKRPQSAR